MLSPRWAGRRGVSQMSLPLPPAMNDNHSPQTTDNGEGSLPGNPPSSLLAPSCQSLTVLSLRASGARSFIDECTTAAIPTPYKLRLTILSPLPLPGGGPPPLTGGGGAVLAAPPGGADAVVRRRARGARAAPLSSGGDGSTGERLG